MPEYVLLCHAVSQNDGSTMQPIPPQYLKSYDIEAHNGRGSAELTEHIKDALRFPDTKAALDAWKTQSKTMPLREDGKPNRPLTAFTVELVSVNEQS